MKIVGSVIRLTQAMDDVARWNLYHTKVGPGETHSAYAEEKEKLFPRGSLVCDLGGGTGDDAIYFIKNGHRVIIMDISDYALKKASDKAKKEELGEALEVKHVDFGLHQLSLVNDSVDVVYSRLSLHYFPASDMQRIFQEIYRILKKGGRAFISLKSQEDIKEMDYLRSTASEYEPGVFIENGQLRSRFTRDQLINILQMSQIANFQVNPYREKLATGEELYLSEIVISKV